MNNTPYTFLVSVNNPVPVSGLPPGHLPPDTEMASTIRLSGARREDVPLARVFAPRTTHRLHREAPVPFWIHNGPDDGPLCSVRPAAVDVYDVSTPDGALLARITRRGARLLPWPRRVRWSAQFTNPPRPVTGKAGTWCAWFVYVVTAPLWLLVALCMLVYSLIDGTTGDQTPKSPTRTRWRTSGAGTVLDYRGLSKTYRLDPSHLDTRVAYALAVLQTWDRKG